MVPTVPVTDRHLKYLGLARTIYIYIYTVFIR